MTKKYAADETTLLAGRTVLLPVNLWPTLTVVLEKAGPLSML